MADIGSTLREARMRARIDISEVEARTKIRAKYLRAIENEEWDLLPGDVFVKSFLRTYGDYLGLDSRLLVDEFKRRYENPSDHDIRPMATRTVRERERERDSRGPRRPLLPPVMLIGIVVIAIVAVLYLVGQLSGTNQPSQQAKGGGGGTGTTRHTGTGAGRGTTTPGSTTTGSTTTTPIVPASVTLQLTPTGTVWVCVENAASKPLIKGLLYNLGDTIPTEKSSKLLVTLGNANVTMKANGKTYPLTASATAIGLKVTPTGVTPLSPGPTCA